MFKCSECGGTIEKLPENRARCPHCGSRMLYKPRQETVRKIKAR